MTLAQRQVQAFRKLRGQSPATLVWGSRTPVSVYKKPTVRKSMNLMETSYMLTIDDFYVLVDSTDIADWDHEQLRMARVTVDGTTYKIGQNLEVMAGLTKIYLKAII
jgi:hypothetical protein